jgi:hypothetical protein
MPRPSRRRPASRSLRRRAGPARRAAASAGPICSPHDGAARRRQRAPAAGLCGVVPAALPRCAVRAAASTSTTSAWAPRASPTPRRCWRCRSSTPGARRRSTRSPRRPVRSRAALRRRHRARARGRRERAGRASQRAQRADTLQRRRIGRRGLGRAQSLYNRGQIDLLPLLDAQRQRLVVRVSANDSHTQLLLDSVQLYKALGGGWQVFDPIAEPAQASAAPSPTLMTRAARTRTSMKNHSPLSFSSSRRPPRCFPAARPTSRRRAAARGAHGRDPLRQGPGDQPLRRHRAVAPRSERGLPRRRQGRLQRKVDVGQKVREGDVLAVLDDTDYRQAEEAARQQHVAAVTQARQAESDRSGSTR